VLDAACAAHEGRMDEILKNLTGSEKEDGLLGELSDAEDAGKEKLLANLDSSIHEHY